MVLLRVEEPMTHLRPLLLAALVAPFVLPASARAFCGFYVAAEDGPLYSDATQVVLLRVGTTTVLSMQNAYRGPLEDFALVVPVPVVLDEDRVKTLEHDIFARVDKLASPRLVEYWEQDPCQPFGTIGLGNLGTIGHGGGGGTGSGYGRGAGGLRVTVEAEFAVGEYEIVILGAEDSSDLEIWLRQNGYHIPAGASDALRPYVARGMKFFVAKVDASKVRFEEGRAVLSPLRVHYDEEQFQLPIRLGQLSSPGTQDLIVHILANNQRYEVANRPNVTIPTNLQVADSTRENFGGFYDALFSEVRSADPTVVVTEYAWQANGCDPCPGPVLSTADLLTFGANLAEDTSGEPVMIRGPAVQVDGPLNVDLARRLLRRSFGAARRCVNGTPSEGVSVGSIFRFDVTVNPDGSVASVETVDPPNAANAACIGATLERDRYPTQDAPTKLTVRYPVVALRGGSYDNYVLTRLHTRYGRDLDSDLVFTAAEPIVGGREHPSGGGFGFGRAPDTEPTDPTGASPSATNNFQGRYIIRHEWEGPIECDEPRRGIWGGPPGGGQPETSVPPRSVSRGAGGGAATDLASLLVTDLPDLAIAAARAPDPEPEPEPAPTTEHPPAAEPGGGCGSCAAAGPTNVGWALLLLAAGLFVRRRR